MSLARRWRTIFAATLAAALVMTVLAALPSGADGTDHFTIAAESKNEGTSATTTTYTFTVTVSEGYTGGTVTYTVGDDDDTATRGEDYAYTDENSQLPGDGVLVFEPGATTKTITVEVNADAAAEPNETLTVTIQPTPGHCDPCAATATIINDDGAAPVATVTGPSSGVPEETTATPPAPGTATFQITLDKKPSAGTVTVFYETVSGTAKEDEDFAATSGSVTFTSAEADPLTKSVNVPLIADTKHENDESFTLTIDPSNANCSTCSASATIIDNDPPPTVSIADASQSEGDSTSELQFAVTLSAPSGKVVTVNYATADGTAKAGSDYTAESGVVTFQPDDTSETIGIEILGDLENEDTETFSVTLSGASNATIAREKATGTITDDDDQPTLSINDQTVTEGDSGTTNAVFTVTLSEASGRTVTVHYETSSAGSQPATPGADYTTTAGDLTFEPGETTKTIPVPIIGDRLDELDETFAVTLTNATNAAIADGTGDGTIEDDDAVPTFSVDDVTTPNESVNATFTITLSAPSGQETSVTYTTSDGSATAGDDYGATSGTVTFAPGETTKTFEVAIYNDTIDEPDETFHVTLSQPSNAELGDPNGVGTITDDDAGPVFSISDAFVTETDGAGATLTFTVTRTGTTTSTITVPYSTEGFTATEGEDYTPPAEGSFLTFAPEDYSEQIVVPVTGDNLAEATESMFVNLGTPSSGTIGDGRGEGTIQDDEGNPPTLSITDETVSEGTGGTQTLTFTVSRTTAANMGEVKVDYATQDGTAIGGADYTAQSGTLTIPTSESSATITVTINPDNVDESTETFSVLLSKARNASIAKDTGTGTITDDDTSVINVAPSEAEEGSGGEAVDLVFTVTLSNPSAATVTVNYATSDGTAKAGEDYTAASGTLQFKPGEVTKTVAVTVIGDDLHEANETVVLTLSAPTGGATIGTGSATGTIVDNDVPVISIADAAAVTESDTGVVTATFVVTRSGDRTKAVSVQAATDDGTATAPSDYTSFTGRTIEFAAGETEQTVTVDVIGDTRNEGVEEFSVVLSQPSGGAVIGQSTGSATIDDNDPLPSLSVNDVTAAELDSGTRNHTFTVTLSSASGREVTVDYATSNGTATAPSDYAATSGTLVFAAGETSKSFTVVARGDTADEPNETYTVTLTNPVNAAIADGQGTATITDDDPTPAATTTTTAPNNGGSSTQGYSLVGEDGSLYAFGTAKNVGDMKGKALNAPIIGVAYTPGGNGYWLVAKDGGIFTFGDAEFFGSMGGSPINSPVIGMAATPTGRGYWLFAGDGGIFTFGDAKFFGSMGDQKLNAPVINMEPLESGNGYWLVAADGGIFTFGLAEFFGSMGDKKINQPVFDMTSTDTDGGYWLVARDGGIFSFGDAEPKFYGSAVNEFPRPTKVIGMDSTPGSLGYWIADASGKVYEYGNAEDLGDRYFSNNPAPMISFASVPGLKP